MSQPLNPIDFPLWGSRLIEASAGTGKTWTIAALYLRLVLGHGGEEGFGRPLQPGEILVMTFTRAATRELSDRIRARLLEAARCFRGETEPAPGDALLARLLEAYPDEAGRAGAAWRLAVAAEGMDEAAVHTIDAWCQRMLREHAFDSGNPFDETLSPDERSLLTEAAHDYWRQHCYPLAGAELDAALAVWPGVNAFAGDMAALAGQPIAEDAGEGTLADCLRRTRRERDAALHTIAEGWAGRAREMRDWLDSQTAPASCDWNRSKLRPDNYRKWLAQLETWAQDPLATRLDLTEAARKRLCPSGLLEARKAGAPAIALPAHFEAFAALLAGLAALPEPAVAARLHAAASVARRLQGLKRQARSFGFADMLERLDHALAGPHGARLRERILAQYPVALIDEFQDTSPLQYRLFDRLYRTADNARDSALLLIGDPKQSIYAFRGADIHSYLQARRATAGRHYVLDTNYRSTAALVDAVNRCFGTAEARAGEGAFLFRSGGEDPLPFVQVAAKDRDAVLQSAAGAVPALTVCHDLALRSTAESRRFFAARCAERIVGWLNDERAGFASPDGGFERLRPADIAVLVRTGTEAAAVRHALRRRGVSSVYLSDKDSVFASEEARDLLHWLRAVASPLDAQRVRAGFATRTLDLPPAELAWLAASDEAFEARSEQVRSLNRVWREQGVLAMLRRTLHLLDLPARWLTAADGERRLTNVLHLAELLQAASAALDGEQALIRWLATQIGEAGAAGDEQVLRLESDADLVKVVTVHKSKGLEYPVVCLPFPCSFRPVERRNTRFVRVADETGRRALKLHYDDEDLARAERERLQEDLRLLYVALTRPRHALWMGFAAIRIGNGKACRTHDSAPGYLLGGTAARAENEWIDPLQALADAAGSGDGPPIVLEAAGEEVGHSRLQARSAPPALQDRPPYAADFERDWALGSFSALVRDLATTPAPMAATQRQRAAEDEIDGDAADGPAAPGPAAAVPWHRFPKGSFSGDFLHAQLEWLAAEGFALDGDPALEARLRRRCEGAGRGAYADDVVAWMRALTARPLPSLGAALSELPVLLPELEFWLPAGALRARELDALCRAHLLAGRARPELPARVLHGMLMGFADLVFEHDGRYWVLDYKSNTLGRNDAAYHHDALEAAMAAHRYDVQAALYLLALHRLLRARLGEAYAPARQLGGAIYFFLRGIDGPARGEYFIPPPLALIDALDAMLAAEEHGA
ncbi:MAG: exodeoxyribonuclease V subunit beta [Thauera phenolivorans]|uniref:RecBCD enzyme subunit RecB n=1 Tax=Thauera phenolivorans TaxID=1792543 RepID=A0A7X7LUY9_9RHOO|nr:exodeoxyribonuclease V subunit beta [Thauera phenolivorans]